MIQISLPEHTMEKLERAAQMRGTDVSELIDQIIEQYISNDKLSQINQEQSSFEAQHALLLEKYAGQYVAMYNGGVVDHDADRISLGKRVRARFGSEPVLITPVLGKKQQVIHVRSPRVLDK